LEAQFSEYDRVIWGWGEWEMGRWGDGELRRSPSASRRRPENSVPGSGKG